MNDKVNTREAGHLRGYRAHYDVIVMKWRISPHKRSDTVLVSFHPCDLFQILSPVDEIYVKMHVVTYPCWN